MKRPAPLKKTVAKKPVTRRKPARKPKRTAWQKAKRWLAFLLAALFIAAGYHYRNGLLYYLGFKTDKHIDTLTKEERKLADLRIYDIVARNKDKVFGIDISHYQGEVDWNELQKAEEQFPLQFIFIRATAGKDSKDSRFKSNWKNAGENGYIRGAYHYYRPDENALLQAEHFIKTVKLGKGDLPPVLDIEKIPRGQSMDSLKVGLQRWLDKVEGHYKMRPILYSGESFFNDFLKTEFSSYTMWIANYSFFEEDIKPEWQFWQFTDQARINGVDGNVDVNIYNGRLEELLTLVK